MRVLIRKVIRDRSGNAMLEYVLLLMLIAAITFGIVTTLGHKVSNAFSTANASIPSGNHGGDDGGGGGGGDNGGGGHGGHGGHGGGHGGD